MRKGFSLIETLVVIAVFAVIATIVSQSTTAGLLGSRKSDATSQVREELDHALSVMERHLRTAKSIAPADCSTTGVTVDALDFTDQNGTVTNFTCVDLPSCSASTNTYVASGSGSLRLTSQENICITSCQFTCRQPVSNLPPTVEIVLEGKSKNSVGAESASIRVQTSVTLRAY